MNEIVKYNNYMNKLYFTKFKAVEYDLLMALCAKLRDKNTNIITLSFTDIKNIIQYTKHTNENFVECLKSMNRKLMDIICEIEVDGKIIMFVLFPTFEINSNKQELTVCVNERFKFILNELIKNFTKFDLAEFIGLNSKYSKTLYRLLKQFKTTGRYEVNLYDFRKKIDCPESYSTKYVMDKVIKPSVHELQNYFSDLQCIVQYEHKRGKPVSGYIFTFEPEKIPQPKISVTTVEPPRPQKDILSQEETDKLVNEFGKELVMDYIERTTKYNCCNYNKIRQWIKDDKDKKNKKQKQFDKFIERETNDEELKELEGKLLKFNRKKPQY